MTDIKISALPTIAQGSVGVATDSIPITQGAVTYKVTPTALVLSSINANSTGSGSVVLSTSPVINAPDINGGTVDGTVIGGAVPAAGSFTTLNTFGDTTIGVGVAPNLTLGSKSGNINAKLTFAASNAQTNWQIKTAHITDTISIIPSTVAGGDVFTTPVATFSSTGLSVTGGISATGALTTAGLKEDASGNLGLGVVPSAWGSTWKSMQIGIVGSIAAQTNTTAIHVSSNEYINSGGTSTYIAGDFAGKYRQISGQHSWHIAPSGTAGQPISFTQALTLDASGNLLVGTTEIDGNIGGSSGVNTYSFRSYDGMRIAQGGATYWNRYTAGPLLYIRCAGVTVGSIDVTASATSYNTSSDYRLKNITGPVTDSGAYIDSLKPVQGTWKADGSTFVGLIAHEAQEASRTHVATGTKDGDEMQGMDYSSAEIIANLIAEIQSLRQRLATAGI